MSTDAKLQIRTKIRHRDPYLSQIQYPPPHLNFEPPCVGPYVDEHEIDVITALNNPQAKVLHLY